MVAKVYAATVILSLCQLRHDLAKPQVLIQYLAMILSLECLSKNASEPSNMLLGWLLSRMNQGNGDPAQKSVKSQHLTFHEQYPCLIQK
jgi:hypothetical protein